MQIVTITSQGQITIPAKMRRALSLNKNKQVLIDQKEGRLVIEPVKDLLDLGGSLKHAAIKNKSTDEVIELEDQAWGEGVAEDYRKKFK